MAAVKMSDVAYNGFKELLKENNIEADILRINLSGNGWSGPVFNIVLDEQKSEDEVTEIGDLKFIVEKELVEDFGGFTILSPEETGREGFSLDPDKGTKSGGCSSCSSCS